MTSLKKPKPLSPNDKVSLLSPAGPLPSADVADQCFDVVKSWGYDVQMGQHTKSKERYLAGTDQQRALDLNTSFEDTDTRAIFCTRGGYGCGRLLDLVNYKAFEKDPMILSGFSDLTALHHAILTQSNCVSLHSPTIAMSYVYDTDRITPDGHELFMKMITKAEPMGSMKSQLDFSKVEAWNKGKAKGQLIGGNLAVFAGIQGSKYFPDPEGKILFAEDLAESPYKLDRYMTQLRISGFLDKLNGIILGHFTDCEDNNEERGDWKEAIRSCLDGLSVPIIAGYPTGHEEQNAPIPLGCDVEIDADSGDVVYLESFCEN